MFNENTTTEFTLEDDLRILTLMTERIVNYVRGNEVYGNQGMFVAGAPAITLGGILMRVRRLNALREELNPSDRASLDLAIANHNEAYQDWTNHYENKLIAEAQSRLDRIQQFVQEYQENPDSYEIAFEPEQTRRTIVQEILYMMQRANIEDDELISKVRTIDDSLKALVTSSTFQWDEKLEDAYNSDEFWWLYSSLAPTD